MINNLESKSLVTTAPTDGSQTQLSVINKNTGNLYEHIIETDPYAPIVSAISQKVGKRKILSIFIPNHSDLYYKITNDDQYKKLAKDVHIRSKMEDADIIPNITNIEKIDNGINIDINIENIKLQTIRIAEDYKEDDSMSTYYYFGFGHVVEVMLSFGKNKDTDSLYRTVLNFSHEKYIAMLINLGYKKENKFKQILRKEKGFSYEKYDFSSLEIFENQNNVATIKTYLDSSSFSMFLKFYDKNDYKKVNKIIENLKTEEVKRNYQFLNQVLK